MTKNSLLSNIQLFPELSQAIDKFARQKNIKFQTAIIELLTIGLEQVESNNKNTSASQEKHEIQQPEVQNLETIINNLTKQLVSNNSLNVNPQVIEKLTMEILKSQISDIEIPPQNNIKGSELLPSNYVQIPYFFTVQEQEKLIQYCLKNQQKFLSATTSTNDDRYRQSQVLHSFPEFHNLIADKITDILPEVLAKLAIPNFESTQIEAQITAHNNGHFYKIHNDNGSPDTATRILTYVYYFYQEPKAFSGGELKIYDSKVENNHYVAAESFHSIEPINNSIIFFLSHYMHEVLPIKCPTGNFADSRFTINGWIRKGD